MKIKLIEEKLNETTKRTTGVQILLSLLDVIDPEGKYHPLNFNNDLKFRFESKKGNLYVSNMFCIHHGSGGHNDNNLKNVYVSRIDDHNNKQYPSKSVYQIFEEYMNNILSKFGIPDA